MSLTSADRRTDSTARAISREILIRLTRDLGPRNFAVEFWDGTRLESETGRPADFTLMLSSESSVRSMFFPPSDLTLGEAYMYGEFDVEGDMHAFVSFLRRLEVQRRTWRQLLWLGWRLRQLPTAGRQTRVGLQGARLTGRLHSRARDRQAVGFHYDTSNEFFALFLDPRMVYTSSYFHSPDDSLAAAQEQKLDYICRKLRLSPGERLLDIGCGWGGLITFAAEHYGVHATGVTLSRAQADFAAAEIARRGLSDRCSVEYRDYRDLETRQPFDKIATVEVLEHFADSMLPVYFRKVSELLRPGGVMLVQAITLTGPTPIAKWRRFIRKYIFPDGKLRPVSMIGREAENAGLEVRDVESLREHYAATLGCWLENLEARHDEAVQACNESTYRAFRLYLAGARYGYTSGVYNVHQSLFVKPRHGESGMPLTRADWYVEPSRASSDSTRVRENRELSAV